MGEKLSKLKPSLLSSFHAIARGLASGLAVALLATGVLFILDFASTGQPDSLAWCILSLSTSYILYNLLK